MKISVVIPVYNKEKYMDDLFQCLLSQTFEESECILIDDGSTDASGEICDKVACIDKRFEVIHIPNSGVSHARNVGIDASCGEYITFIDADDRIPNNYLENLYETIIESGVDLSICTITKIWHSGKKKKIQLPGSGTFDISELLLNFADYQKKTGIYGYCCGKIILKELVGNIRFDERIKLAEDFDFFLKLYPKVALMIKQNIFIFRNQRIHQLWLRIVKLTIEHSCLLIFAINIFLKKKMFIAEVMS